MASVPWSPPWALTNRTETLSPAQVERILQMHKESKQNAVIYVLVVLVLYFVALAILVGRYLQDEGDHDTLVCIGQALERCVGRCRRSPSPAKQDGIQDTAPSATICPRRLSVAHRAPPPRLNLPKEKRAPPPQTDSSSDNSSPSSPPPPSPSSPSSPQRPLDTLTVYANDCPAEGRAASPAVVSIMVCDLQDTPV